MKRININGEIGYDSTPLSVSEQLEDSNGADLEVHIASPGGSVFDGIEIFNLFRDYKRKNPNSQIMAVISGFAASMATYLSSNPAFDLVVAEDNAVFMIHNVWGGAVGDYRELRKTADIMENITNILSRAYEKKTTLENKKIRKMMDDETWLYGEEIKEMGFVDEIIKTDDNKNKKTALYDAKTKFLMLAEKEKNKKQDFTRLAALLEPQSHCKDKITEKTKSNELQSNILLDVNINPAPNVGVKMEEKTMAFLNDFIVQNPAAKIEFDNQLNAKFEAGKDEGRKEVKARIEKAKVFLNNSEYPKQIQEIALKAVTGDASFETLETMVASVDMFKELNNSISAQKETELLGETDAQITKTTKLSANGEIKTAEDYLAEVARLKASKGMEVR